jgi:hypothetical protein
MTILGDRRRQPERGLVNDAVKVGHEAWHDRIGRLPSTHRSVHRTSGPKPSATVNARAISPAVAAG